MKTPTGFDDDLGDSDIFDNLDDFEDFDEIWN